MSEDDVTAMQSVVLFVLEKTGITQLSYSDYSIIEGWIEQSENLDQLLLILSETIPSMKNSSSRLSLAGFNKKVLRQLSIKTS